MSGILVGELTAAEIHRAVAIEQAAAIITGYGLAILTMRVAAAWEPIRRAHASAKHALRIQQAQQDRLKNFWPYELQHLYEWGSKPEPEAPAVMGSRYAGRLIVPVAGAYAKAIHSVKCNATRYCTSATQQAMQAAFIGRATDEAHARVEGYNIGFAEYHDRRWLKLQRWLDAVGIGSNIISNASTLISAASHTYSAKTQVAVGSVMGAMQSIIQDQTTPIAGTSVEEWYGGNLAKISGMSAQQQYQQLETPREAIKQMLKPLDIYRQEPSKLVEDRYAQSNSPDVAKVRSPSAVRVPTGSTIVKE